MLYVAGTKTSASAGSVPLIPDLANDLRLHRERQARVGFERVKPDALVFATRTGKSQSRRNALRAVHVAGDTAGLNQGREKVGLHDLRHSCAGILRAVGTPIAKVSAILRHSSARVTMTVYAGLAETEREGLRDDLAAAFSAR